MCSDTHLGDQRSEPNEKNIAAIRNPLTLFDQTPFQNDTFGFK